MTWETRTPFTKHTSNLLTPCPARSVQPHDYAMNLQAMTKEKLQFLLPVVFTVGPDVNARGANSSAPVSHGRQPGQASQEDRGDALMKYAMLLTDTSAKSESNTTQFLGNIVKGIIEGETRVLVSSMTMEEIFTEREEFSKYIFQPSISQSRCQAKSRGHLGNSPRSKQDTVLMMLIRAPNFP